jgi:DNA-directed RNA polymerase subunit K/omega
MPISKDEIDYSDGGSDTGSDAGSEKSGGGADDYSDGNDIDSIMSDLDYEGDEGAVVEDEGAEYEDVEQFSNNGSDAEDDDDDDKDDNYLQKFSEQLKTNVITEHHPELIISNFHEVDALCHVVRDADGTIIDPLHTTVPFVTKYEKAKILGERAKQLNAGAMPFVEVNEDIIDGYLIALAEFEQKKIPMIIRRPLPNNASEYWRLQDLEIL